MFRYLSDTQQFVFNLLPDKVNLVAPLWSTSKPLRSASKVDKYRPAGCSPMLNSLKIYKESSMKHNLLIMIFLTMVLLTACATPPNPSGSKVDSNATPASPVNPATNTPAQSSTDDVSEEAQIKDLVFNFGKRLQNVSLLAPDAAQEIKNQYSEFVSPSLLEMWMNDVSKAPGRMVSSPWPDRIEITNLSKEGSDKYEVTGNVIEVTSVEVANGGAANKIPVRMVVQKVQGSWYIAGFEQ